MEKHNIFFIFLLLMCLFLILINIFMLLGFIYPNCESHNNDYCLVNKNDNQESTENIILGATEDYGQNYIDKIIFLGESTTYGLQHYGILSGGINTNQVWTGATVKNGVTISAGTFSLSPTIETSKIFYPDSKTAITIKEAIIQKRPEYLIITLGLNNGASYYSENEFKYCYRILLNSINTVSTNTNIILQSLFPISEKCKIKAYTPERIALCNKWIYDIAKEYGLKYLNTVTILEDSNGYLIHEYDNGGDGIHLNQKGLDKVIEYIKTHGYPKE